MIRDFLMVTQFAQIEMSLHFQISKKLPVVRKVADDVLGGDDAWKHAEQTEAACPTCGHRRAYYTQVQTRSADGTLSVPCLRP